jgi:aspartyl-tRNA(Asn)/glutamyl-tRNA(Gln) amidotransferase subunit A
MRWDELEEFTLATLSKALAARTVSPVEVTEACLDRITRFNGPLNAFITVAPERARADARRAEREIARGDWRGALHGVPIAIKDNFATGGIPTTCGARILRDWIPERDATVARRLAEAGSILLGKTNMSEFAFAAIHPDFGPPRNPWNLDRFTGGSSSGSAAAVATSLCFGSVGTDTGASIRGPAGHCGIVGFKPTYGLVSRAGVIPLSWSLDHTGPIARTVDDAGILLDAISGFDPSDPTSVSASSLRGQRTSLQNLARDVRRLRVGVLNEFLGGSTTPGVAACVHKALQALEPFIGTLEEVALPRIDEAISAWTTICYAEASAYHQQALARRPQDFSDVLRERLLAGLAIPAVQYVQAQRVRRMVSNAYAALFQRIDLLVLPTNRTEAPTIADAITTTGRDDLRDRLVHLAPFNLAGLPAVSVPCGFTSLGLPVGLQIVGPRFTDWRVLATAGVYEQTSGWSRARPRIGAASQPVA